MQWHKTYIVKLKKKKLRQGKEKLTKATENNIQKQIEEERIILTLGSRWICLKMLLEVVLESRC